MTRHLASQGTSPPAGFLNAASAVYPEPPINADFLNPPGVLSEK